MRKFLRSCLSFNIIFSLVYSPVAIQYVHATQAKEEFDRVCGKSLKDVEAKKSTEGDQTMAYCVQADLARQAKIVETTKSVLFLSGAVLCTANAILIATAHAEAVGTFGISEAQIPVYEAICKVTNIAGAAAGLAADITGKIVINKSKEKYGEAKDQVCSVMSFAPMAMSLTPLLLGSGGGSGAAGGTAAGGTAAGGTAAGGTAAGGTAAGGTAAGGTAAGGTAAGGTAAGGTAAGGTAAGGTAAGGTAAGGTAAGGTAAGGTAAGGTAAGGTAAGGTAAGGTAAGGTAAGGTAAGSSAAGSSATTAGNAAAGQTSIGCIMCAAMLALSGGLSIDQSSKSNKAQKTFVENAKQLKTLGNDSITKLTPAEIHLQQQNPDVVNTAGANPSSSPSTDSCANQNGNQYLSCMSQFSPEISAITNSPAFMNTMNKALHGKNLGDFLKGYDGESDLAQYVANGLGMSPGFVAGVMNKSDKFAKDSGYLDKYTPSGYSKSGGPKAKVSDDLDFSKIMAGMMGKMDPNAPKDEKTDPSELVFRQLELLPADKIEGNKDISLFARIAFRYRKNATNLEKLNWARPENQSAATSQKK